MGLWEQAYQPERPSGVLASALWWLIGNAEDGPYGRFAGAHTVDDRFLPIDWKAAWKWWLRNPMHNVFFHGIDIDFTSQKVLVGRAEADDPRIFSLDGGLFVAINGGPIVSYKSGSFEAYAGWRSFNKRGGGRHGVLGVTIRKRG